MRNCYADPTANTAIANVDRERRREEKRKSSGSKGNMKNISGSSNGRPDSPGRQRERILNNRCSWGCCTAPSIKWILHLIDIKRLFLSSLRDSRAEKAQGKHFCSRRACSASQKCSSQRTGRCCGLHLEGLRPRSHSWSDQIQKDAISPVWCIIAPLFSILPHDMMIATNRD